MDLPVRVAFCKILFWKNGGRFNKTGLPVLEDQVRGKCDRAYDCGSCSYLQEWISWLHQQGWNWGWECDRCLRETKNSDIANGVLRHVQGFYQSGRQQTLSPDDPDYDPDRPTLAGCTRCGWESSFLQLVIRKAP